eukprot:scaffold186397_cov16-Tisochrysis_lutea.AAC.1
MKPIRRKISREGDAEAGEVFLAKAAAGAGEGAPAAEPEISKVIACVLVAVCGAFAFGKCMRGKMKKLPSLAVDDETVTHNSFVLSSKAGINLPMIPLGNCEFSLMMARLMMMSCPQGAERIDGAAVKVLMHDF